jgi:hypothetical protein
VAGINIHLLTAVTRPALLPAVAESVAEASTAVFESDATVTVVWHVRPGVPGDRGGYRTKNALLEAIPESPEEWVILLDDDNVLHPRLLVRFAEVIDQETEAVIVSCESALHGLLRAAPENVKVGSIDAAQAILRRDCVGERRWRHLYTGDGRLLEQLVPELKKVVYLDEVLAYHNKLQAPPPAERG